MPSVGNWPIAGTSIFDEESVVAAVQQPINRGRPNPPVPEQSALGSAYVSRPKDGQWPLVVRIIVSLLVLLASAGRVHGAIVGFGVDGDGARASG